MSEGTTTDIVRPDKPAIYAAAMAVMNQVQGIGKNRRMPKEANVGEYAYRANEDVQDQIGRAFRDFGIATQARDCHLVQVQSNVQGRFGTTVWTSVFVTITYVFTSLEDGSELCFSVAGEGRDNSDKATNKAMTAAHKTAVTTLFEVAYGAQDPESERPMIQQEDAYRPEPPPQEDKRTPAQRQAEEAYRARRAGQAPATTPEQREDRRQAEAPAQTERRTQATQTQPVTGDPLADAQRSLAEEMGANPANAPTTADQHAAVALTRAARTAVQADLAGNAIVPRDAAQADRARKAVMAGRAATSRDQLARIIMHADTEGLLALSVDGFTVGAELSAVRGTLVA